MNLHSKHSIDRSRRPFEGGSGAMDAEFTREWRCTRCDKLLGVCRDGRMHLRFARGHEYFVGFPVQATCRGCGTLNNATAPAH